MHRHKLSQDRRAELFVSAKTVTAIPVVSGLLHDSLVAATLDPAVRKIGLVPPALGRQAPVGRRAIVIERDDGSFVLDVRPERPSEGIGETADHVAAAARLLGLPLLTVSEADIRREPRFTNSRLVWDYRTQPVPIGLRLQVLQLLADEGPMPLRRLLPAIRTSADPVAAVLALACQDIVDLDLLSAPIGPSTIARVRS